MKTFIAAVVFWALPLSGFAEGVSTQIDRTGVVESVSTFNIYGENTGHGAIVGSMAGAMIQAGRSGNNLIATIGGALIGSLIGSVAEYLTKDKEMLEVNVLLDNGERITIKQETGEQFVVGDRVRVADSHVSHE